MSKIKTSEWDEYEYDINVTVCSGGKMLKLKPVQIQSLMIEKDYDGVNLPVLLLTISTQESSDISINNKAEFIISIDRFIVTKNKKGKVTQKKKKTNVLRDTFSPMITDTTETSSNTLTELAQKENKVKKDEIVQSDFTGQDTYTLFRKKDLIASKHVFNHVLSNVTMTETIATLLSQASVSKVLMSSLDNTEKIPELLLMPLGLLSQLSYLKNYYGWHKEDTVMFMDYDTTYLIRMNGKCTAWRSGEVKKITFYINSITKGDNICGGMVSKGNGLYVNVGADDYVTEDSTSVVEQTTGTNVMMVNENEASVDTINGTATNTLSQSGSTTVKSTTGHNQYISNWVKYRSKEQSGIVNLTCNHVDFSQFTPNKEYTMASEKTTIAKEVKGNYRLSKVSTSFAKEGNNFISKSNILLKKSVG